MKQKDKTNILLLVVSFGLMICLGLQVYLFNEIQYLWGEIEVMYEAIYELIQHYQPSYSI